MAFVNLTKHTASFANESKSNASFSNQAKNSANFSAAAQSGFRALKTIGEVIGLLLVWTYAVEIPSSNTPYDNTNKSSSNWSNQIKN